MLVLQEPKSFICDNLTETVERIFEFVQNRGRFALLVRDLNEPVERPAFETVGKSILSTKGQFFSLDMSDLLEKRFSGQLLAAFENSNAKKGFQINLPLILKDNPHSDSPFINRAIIWQRLCDRMIEDEDQERPTLFVLENIDQATLSDQHDIARLVRFHNTHRIRRSFLATLSKDQYENLKSELRELAELIIEVG